MGIDRNILKSDILEDISVIPSVPVQQYVLDNLERNIKRFGDQEWMTDYSTGKTVNYQQVAPMVRAMASGLRRHGVMEGDFVVFYSHNQVEFPLMQLAVFQCGGCCTSASPSATVSELLDRSKETGAKFIICDETSASKAIEATRMSDWITEVFVFGHAHGCIPVADLVADDGMHFPKGVRVDLDTVAWLPYSSGTTGPPKGVIHTHRTMLGLLYMMKRQPRPDYKSLFVNFMTHIGGTCTGLISLTTHNRHYTLSRFTDEDFLHAIHDVKPDCVSAFPPQIGYIVKHPDLNRFDLSSVRAFFTGGAILPHSFEMELPKKMPNLGRLTLGYGMTEVGVICAMNDFHSKDLSVSPDYVYKPGCSGKLYPHNQLKVVHEETNEILGPNHVGHVCVKNPFITKGYLNHPETTSVLIREDGWVYTGDLGYFDQDGYIFITGRIKDLIKYRMASVAPAVIERLLISLPSVIDAVVVGLPDEMAGELPAAFVVVKPSSSVTDEDISKYIDEHVADEAKLRGGIHFVDCIPRNDSGKPLKRVVLEKYLVENRENNPAA